MGMISLETKIVPLTESNIAEVHAMVNENSPFNKYRLDYFIRGTLGDERFRPELSLVLVNSKTGEIMGCLVAVVCDDPPSGKSCVIKVLVVAMQYQRNGYGSLLLAELIERARKILSSKALLRYGDSIPSYWQPGVDLRDTSLLFFLQKHNFQKSAFRMNLTYEIPELSHEPMREKNGYLLERLQHKDLEALQVLAKTQFYRGWDKEIEMSCENDPITTFVAKDSEGNILGWATHSAHFINQVEGGIASFGPTGVEKSLRGKGIGGELLRWCMWDMKQNGISKSHIVWVEGDTAKFYAKSLGAYISPVFYVVSRPLESPPISR